MGFQFKEFYVAQDRCAMKVSTDACLFGAYVVRQHKSEPRRILDIGAGTGVLSLMLAQQFEQAFIDGVELDREAAAQCQSNFDGSAWAHRLQAYPLAVQEFFPEECYDLIISNPPFFEVSLASPNSSRQKARQQGSLSLQDLVLHSQRLLSQEGTLWVLLPEDQQILLRNQFAEIGWGCAQWTVILGRANASKKRVVAGYKKSAAAVKAQFDEITIRSEGNTYTKTFTLLLKPYYAIL